MPQIQPTTKIYIIIKALLYILYKCESVRKGFPGNIHQKEFCKFFLHYMSSTKFIPDIFKRIRVKSQFFHQFKARKITLYTMLFSMKHQKQRLTNTLIIRKQQNSSSDEKNLTEVEKKNQLAPIATSNYRWFFFFFSGVEKKKFFTFRRKERGRFFQEGKNTKVVKVYCCIKKKQWYGSKFLIILWQGKKVKWIFQHFKTSVI